jgi:hypothetical protein
LAGVLLEKHFFASLKILILLKTFGMEYILRGEKKPGGFIGCMENFSMPDCILYSLVLMAQVRRSI